MIIMNSDVILIESIIIDEIEYNLYCGINENIGIIHIIDIPNSEMIDLVKYPTYSKAHKIYDSTIYIAS